MLKSNPIQHGALNTLLVQLHRQGENVSQESFEVPKEIEYRTKSCTEDFGIGEELCCIFYLPGFMGGGPFQI